MVAARSHAANGAPRPEASTAGLRLGLVGGSVALGLAAGAAVGVAAITAAFARAVVTPPHSRTERERVLAVNRDSNEIVLADSADARVQGEYSLWFDGGTGHARVGRILAVGKGRVTRELGRVDRGELRAGAHARFNGWVMISPREVGLPFEAVQVATQYGAAPAWLFPAATDSGLWAVHVHGRATRREETLRGARILHDAGYTSLVVSYRNDGDAPSSPDGRYGLGATEWRDVDAAIRYAERGGARSIVLVGWSMGGAIALQTVTRSSRRASVTGVILDSPVIDWRATLRLQARLMAFPSWIAAAVITTLQQQWATCITGQSSVVSFETFDFVTRAAELDVPILLMHSVDDGYVPSEPSEALAKARPDLVEFVRFDTARHTKLWNYAPARWEGAVSSWLERLQRRA
ncbi:alpha/beta fold hydrolase [Microbacteriaceae bacterium VKM Ac-2854]|nr:alpha/beta fold hydrolase [Microbacteriaceae bacterium VKM Ac-2854]